MRDCIKRLVEKTGLSREAAREIIEAVDREARRQASAGFDYDESVSKVIAQRLENTKENITKQKENMQRNLIIKARTVDKMSQMVDQGLSVLDAIRADLEGINSDKTLTRDSIDIQKSAVESAYFSRMIGTLNRENLLGILNSKALDDEIGRELWALSSKEKNVTGSKDAARIAQIIFDTRDGMRQRLNAAGADIGELPGYVMPQRHDTYAMHKAGEQAWVDFMLPLVDESRSFGGDYDNLRDALAGAYKAMVTGVRLSDPLKNEKLFQFSGPANLGKKLSQSRVIHFKDFDSWKKWNAAYGARDLNEGIIDAIHFDAKSIALMERYGTNPEAMLQASITELKKKYRDQLAKSGEELPIAKINSMIDHAVGKDLMIDSPSLARWGSNIRTYNNVTSLGGAVLSAIGDIPLKSLEYKFQGKTWLSSTVQPFVDLSTGFKSKQERIEFASLTGVGMESMIADIGGRFSATDSLSNRAMKVQRMFFKMNGLSWWTDSHKNAMGRVMSHHLGLKRETPFNGLDADTQRLFGNYGITEKDWDTARAAATQLEDGRWYVLPESIKSQKVREKLTGYFIDRSNYGVITPTAREKRISTLGTQRGTPVGETVRLMMQFKGFPISVITKVWGRALYGRGKADVPAMLYLMLNTMAFGYMATTAKDLLKGRSPKDPRKLETAYASLVQGGGAGILADILLQDGSSYGRNLSQALAGPTIGRMDDVFKLYSSAIRGKGTAGQALRTGTSMVPFNNLFYVRPAIDHMLLMPMQEKLNPGYLKRMESNMKRTYGQRPIY